MTNKPEVVAVYRTDTGGVDKMIRLTAYESRMAVLFDGHEVYSALTDKAKQHTSPESVARCWMPW